METAFLILNSCSLPPYSLGNIANEQVSPGFSVFSLKVYFIIAEIIFNFNVSCPVEDQWIILKSTVK